MNRFKRPTKVLNIEPKSRIDSVSDRKLFNFRQVIYKRKIMEFVIVGSILVVIIIMIRVIIKKVFE